MNLNASLILKVRDSVYKELAKFPKKDRIRLVQAIEDLPLNPYRGDIEKMDGELYTWRRRVSAYRIFYDIILEAKIIHVFHVERRTSKTY